MQSKTNVDQMLAESLKRLALKIPIEKITIREITEGAGVIRPTFYNHFKDKYELLEWIIRTEIIEPVIPLMLTGNIRESQIRIFENLQKEKKFYKNFSRLEGQDSCENIVKKLIKEILLVFINEQSSEKKLARQGLTTDLVAEYYARSMAFAVVQWLKQDMKLTPEQMAEIFKYIMTHSMEEVIAEMN